MTFDEFEEYYKKHNICPDDAFIRKNPYTYHQLITRYKKYCKKHMEKTKSQLLREEALKRDKYCQISVLLNGWEQAHIRQEIFGELNQLDMAHVFNKSSRPDLKYDIDNVIMIKRIFHNRLDCQLDPITGKGITKEELKNWWMKIIGKDKYNKLEKK